MELSLPMQVPTDKYLGRDSSSVKLGQAGVTDCIRDRLCDTCNGTQDKWRVMDARIEKVLNLLC